MNNADLYLNDFHRKNSMAAQREVQQMSLHPCSREQKLAQIQRIKEHSMTPASTPQNSAKVEPEHYQLKYNLCRQKISKDIH